MHPISSREFDRLVDDALEQLPPELAERVSNVQITVDDSDGEAGGEQLLGLYEGIPLTVRDLSYSGVLPDRITLYKRNIERAASTKAELAEVIRRTVLHEIAHHFGIDDDRLEELGWD
ncbi:MAG: metallopeptidase family protein [Actinomycetota bacterium]|nr:metallopeptidase family protein [Actinomycetota bacterium]